MERLRQMMKNQDEEDFVYDGDLNRPLTESRMGEGDDEMKTTSFRFDPTQTTQPQIQHNLPVKSQEELQREKERELEKRRRRETENNMYNNSRARALLEDEDTKISTRLYHRDLTGTIRIKVQVPQGFAGGQFMKIIIPGKEGFDMVQIPPGLHGGQTFTYVTMSRETGVYIPPMEHIRLRVPDGVYSNQTFTVTLPSGSKIIVIVPSNVGPGDNIEVAVERSLMYPAMPVPNNARNVNQPKPALSAAQLAEREEFLASLPEDIRREVLEQEGWLQSSETNRGTTPPQPTGPEMLEVTIPPNCYPGSLFDVILSDNNVIRLEVPPGLNPGETIIIPYEEAMSSSRRLSECAGETDGIDTEEEEEEEQDLLGMSHEAHQENTFDFMEDPFENHVMDREEFLGIESQYESEPSGFPMDMHEATSSTHHDEEEPDLYGLSLDDRPLISESTPPPVSAFPKPKTSPMDPFASISSSPKQERSSNLTTKNTAVPESKPDLFHGLSQVAAISASSGTTTKPPQNNESGGSHASSSSTLAPLDRLKEAKTKLDQGLITQAEFKEIKRSVIDSI